MHIGVNSFGPKRKLYHDFEGTLSRLLAMGIDSLEPCVVFGGSSEPPKGLDIQISEQEFLEMSGGIWSLDVAADRISKLRSKGFAIVSVHVFGDNSGPEALESLLPAIKQFGVENDIKCFVISLMKNRAGMQEFIPVLKRFSDALAEAGIYLAYHNHEIEWEEQDGGSAISDLMEQCPNLKLELDVGWAKFAGRDPLAVMDTYADRIVLLHFKDIAADACPENRATCFTAIGEGSIPLAQIMEKRTICQLLEHGIIIDQDDSQTDILDDLAVGAKNIAACR